MGQAEQIWEAVLDGRYRVSVARVAPYRGHLEVVDNQTGTKLHEEEVGLSYDAMFGPDLSDVARWQETAVDVVDASRSDDQSGAAPEP